MTKIILATLLAGQFAFATPLSQPVPPTYESCAPRDGACQSRNDDKRKDYNNAVQAYNVMVREQTAGAGQTTADTAEITQATTSSSTIDALAEAEKKNKKGSGIYKTAATLCALTSAGFAGAFAASCMGVATCNYKFLYASMAFAAFSMLAKSQVKKHDQTAYNACNTANQISSSGRDCGIDPTTTTTPNTSQPWPPTGTDITEVFPVNPDGTCTGTPEQCQTITENLPPGTNIRDVANGLSTFANGSQPLFTVNPDGSITDKNGKKIPASTFGSKDGLVGLGMSPSQASALLSDLGKSGAAGLAGGSGDGKDAGKTAGLSNSGKDVAGTFGEGFGGGGQTLSVNNEGPNGALANEGKDIGAAGASGNGGRDLASAEGLVKDFNGELIGVAGDDIFKMMNRRYILKDTQDSFIAPTP